MDSLPLRLDYESVIRLSTAAEPKIAIVRGFSILRKKATSNFERLVGVRLGFISGSVSSGRVPFS